MALSRLFAANSELHLGSKGRAAKFLRPRRWFSSAFTPSPSPLPPPPPASKKVSKKAESSKEKKSKVIKSFIESYMLEHPGVFPKAKEIRGEVGGSWSILKDALAKVKNKIGIGSQVDKQTTEVATSEATTDVNNKIRLDFHVDKQIAEVATSEATTEVNNKIGLGSQVDKLIAVVATSEATLMEKPMETSELVRLGEGSASLTEMQDVAKPASTEAEYPKLEAVKMSDISENRDPPKLEQSIVIGQQFSDSSSHILVEKESTIIPISGTNSSDVDLAEASPSQADVNPWALNQKSQPVGAISSGKTVSNLVAIFKQDAERGTKLNRENVSSLKHETYSDLKEDNSDVSSLFDALKRNSKVLEDGNICEKHLEQDRSSNQKESLEENPESTGIETLLDRIIVVTKDTTKSGTWASVSSNKSKKVNKGLKPFVNESMSCLSSKEEEDDLSSQPDKGDRQLLVHAVRSFSAASNSKLVLRTNGGQGKQSISCDVGKSMPQLDKDKRSVDSQEVSYSHDISEESDSDVAAFDYPKPSNEASSSGRYVNLDVSPCEKVDSHKNCILVKFLVKSAKEVDIALAFGDCGPITEICLVKSRRDDRFNYAYICFKTEEGLRKALSKSDVTVSGEDVTVEPASLSKTHNRMFNVEPTKDADFPVSFVKNPTRTVMVKGLQNDQSFNHLRRALSVCGHVSGFAMGRSASDVFVEFESEESKDRALAEGSVNLMGTKILIHRIDAPNTTVVRISNVNPLSGVMKIHSICDSCGKVRRLVGRDVNIFDVHFSSSEWTNMVKILNRLNGIIVDEHQWLAQPATIIPAEVLQSLWNQPEGRKHVLKLFEDLCKRIKENSINTAPMLGLTQTYYRRAEVAELKSTIVPEVSGDSRKD